MGLAHLSPSRRKAATFDAVSAHLLCTDSESNREQSLGRGGRKGIDQVVGPAQLNLALHPPESRSVLQYRAGRTAPGTSWLLRRRTGLRPGA